MYVCGLYIFFYVLVFFERLPKVTALVALVTFCNLSQTKVLAARKRARLPRWSCPLHADARAVLLWLSRKRQMVHSIGSSLFADDVLILLILFPARSYYFLSISKAIQVASKNLHTLTVVFVGRALPSISPKHFGCTVNKIQQLCTSTFHISKVS